jgi:hypothetical protein
MKKSDVLIIIGAVLVPTAFSLFCFLGGIYDYVTFVPDQWRTTPDTDAFFLALASFVVAVALGLVSAGFLLQKRGE